MKQYQSLLENTFQDLLNPVKDVDAIRPYFDKDYTQWVDGKMLDYDGFFRHVTALKEVIASAYIEFIEYIEDGDKVADIHDVFVTKKSGEKLHVRVMAFFTFKDQKIASVRELTQLLEGDEADQDIGSRLA